MVLVNPRLTRLFAKLAHIAGNHSAAATRCTRHCVSSARSAARVKRCARAGVGAFWMPGSKEKMPRRAGRHAGQPVAPLRIGLGTDGGADDRDLHAGDRLMRCVVGDGAGQRRDAYWPVARRRSCARCWKADLAIQMARPALGRMVHPRSSVPQPRWVPVARRPLSWVATIRAGAVRARNTRGATESRWTFN